MITPRHPSAISVMILLSLLGWCAPSRGADHLVGVYAGVDGRTMELCQEHGVEVIYTSIRWYEPAPWAKARVAKAHSMGIKVIPSIACAYDGYQENAHAFAQAHPEYWEKFKDGRLVKGGTQVNLSWGHPEVRRFKVDTISRFILDNDFDGILLDYTRFFGNKTGYADIIVNDFKAKCDIDPHTLVMDEPRWVQHRADYVTDFLTDLRAALHAEKPGLDMIACVGPDPAETLRRACQDWLGWLNRGLVDGVVTMIYERNTNNTLKSIMITNDAIAGRVPHVPMIAPYGGNLTTPMMLQEGALKSLKLAPAGVAFYRGDSIYELDLWPTVGVIANWDADYLRATPLNHILNASFENDLEFYALTSSDRAEISDERPRTGAKCLKLGADNAQVRQLIDRGFIPDKKSFDVGFWFNTTSAADAGALALRIDINYRDGTEICQRFDVSVIEPGAWQQFRAALPCDTNCVKFISVSLLAENLQDTVYIDDLTASFTDKMLKYKDHPCPDIAVAQKNRGQVNVAYRQLTDASSFWENGYESDNAVDGDLSSENHGKGSAWHSQRPPKDQWLKIYLDRTYDISRFRLLNTSAQYCYRTREFRIEVSTDDLNYHTVAQGALPNDGTTWTEIAIDPTAAKYIRFVGLNSFHPDYSVGLKEIEIY